VSDRTSWSVRRALRRVALGVVAAAVLAACGGAGPSATASAGPLRPFTIGLTYIPNIQFAPFYVAAELGYYRAAGLDVSLRHHSFSEDEFSAVASGKEDAVFAGGDEMLQARDHSVPLVDVATTYRRYPVVLIAPADSPIRTAADLRGRTVGTPGPYGETYFGLLALLRSAQVSTSDLTVQYIQFTQVAALLGHKVDAVMGYLNNEPIQFRQASFAVRQLTLSDVVRPLPLVANGLGVMNSVLSARPADVRAMLRATLRGLQYAIAHPTQALDMSRKYVPGLDVPKQAADAMAVLQATIPVWQSGTTRPGYNDPATWSAMGSFMASNKLLSTRPDTTKAFSNDYLP
jgi:NitT/TauT family transport system substrate-binding protein